MNIGHHEFAQPLVLAPMAGVSDRVFRRLCVDAGADYAVAEMVASRRDLWQSNRSRRRLARADVDGVHIVQIAGAVPADMAACARHAVDQGADIVDINMGCPAKKVCNRLAGSALLRDEDLVRRILDAVVGAVDVPVTLKIRTGWDPAHRNGVAIAQCAEAAGIAALAVHGRTRACRYRDTVEYDTIAAIKRAVSIPVLANGDIIDAASARRVLAATGADGLMIGRAAHGNPWVFADIRRQLAGEPARSRGRDEQVDMILAHLDGLYALYGETAGLRIARKHVGWYLAAFDDGDTLRRAFNGIDNAAEQRRFVRGLAVARAA